MEQFAIPFAKALLFEPGGSRFLLQRRIKPGDRYFGLWEIPGGRIRDGESMLDALGREVREETGIVRIRWYGQSGEEERDRFGGRARVLTPLVTVEILEGRRPIFGQYFAGESLDPPAASEEAADHRWIAPEEFRAEFLERSPETRGCTTVDALALRIALDGPLASLLGR